MTHDLRLAPELSLSQDFVTKTCAILAQRRKGKTSDLVVKDGLTLRLNTEVLT